MKIRRKGLLWLVCALVIAGFAGPAAADDGWQDEVHLRPESVEALLGNSRDGHGADGAPQSPGGVVDVSSYRDVTVAHDDGPGACETPGAVRVTMTGTTADGGQETIVSQCEVSRVRSSEANEAASAAAQRTPRSLHCRRRASIHACAGSWACAPGCTSECRTRSSSPSRSRATRCVLSHDRSQSR